MTKSNFLIWKNARVPNACGLTNFTVKDTSPLRCGESLIDSFPDDAAFFMRPDSPHETMLTDNLRNTEMIVVGSARLTGFMQANNVPQIEYLPVTINNHKRRPIKEKYFIIHPILPVDCLDLKKSKPTYSLIAPEDIDEIERLVIDERRVPEDRLFFRCRHFDDETLVRRDFAKAIDEQGFTGVRWMELADYSS
jgi:hypothetical protein